MIMNVDALGAPLASPGGQAALTPTLLWALRSPCSKGCRYCYFGTVEEHRITAVSEIGRLSHLHRNDLTPAQVLEFAATLPGSRIRRVFLAGGEPLIWPPIISLIRVLKEGGLQVIVCTEGTPLNRPEITRALLEHGVDAVSVSLDSVDAAYNDRLRPSRNGKDGWNEVVSGIRALIAARGQGAVPKVGIYSVITNQNIADIQAVHHFAERLGCDYVVPQPVALDPDHRLSQMALARQHVPELLASFAAVDDTPSAVHVPAAPYPQQFAASVSTPLQVVKDCFGGQNLFFAQPDGTLWDCPSSHRIAATPTHRRRSIPGADARTLFGQPSPGCGDCALFSADCVSMWPLMDFTTIIGAAR